MWLKKKWKNPDCETVVWSLADQIKNLIEKKWPRLSDSDIVNGGLNLIAIEQRMAENIFTPLKIMEIKL